MDQLAELRERRALTLRELAEMSGVAADSINQIELGHRKPRPSTLRKLARALEVDVEEFYAEPALAAGKAEASTTGRPRMTAKRALEIAGSDSFRREAEGASVEELQQTALELAQFTKPQTREELFKRHKDDKKAQLKEAHQRTMAKTAILAVNEELDHRGAPSPVELVARVFDEAMNPPEETPRLDREEQKGKEAG